MESARNSDFTDIVMIHEHRGEPDGLVVCHMPYGPSAYFGIFNTVCHLLSGSSPQCSTCSQFCHVDNVYDLGLLSEVPHTVCSQNIMVRHSTCADFAAGLYVIASHLPQLWLYASKTPASLVCHSNMTHAVETQVCI